ncbi:GNAT family N-acetyltransferase [Brachybacterium sp. FME24]|uniref:GNAT family N-acetyltransferase n=1 Tax=Brachybacterium sp. FME24 TaxID=2742605 RepID=UPI001867E5A7|nr:GNAT family N-acetyltransferase [Brachybacterium sp. FME24]
MTDQRPQNVSVRNAPEEGSFDVFVEEEHAGSSLYAEISEGPTRQRVFFHTEVREEFGGRGLAATLTSSALEESVRSGFRIVAMCPYVKKWLSTHHDFDDALDPVRPVHIQAVRQASQARP